MSETCVEYRTQGEGLKQATNHAMMPLTQEQRQQLIMVRSAFINGLRLVEGILGCEPSVKTREEKRQNGER